MKTYEQKVEKFAKKLILGSISNPGRLRLSEEEALAVATNFYRQYVRKQDEIAKQVNPIPPPL